MEDFETLTVQLPADLARAVREAVDGQRYVIVADVVVDALGDWQVKQQIRVAKVQRLRELIDAGLASGVEPMAVDEIERIIREGRAQLAGRKASP